MVLVMQALVFAVAWAIASCDEMAFVDVSSTDTINIRQLDVPVNSKRGIANLFTEDPMAAHDWAIQSTMLKSLRAELKAVARPESGAAGRVRRLEEELKPLWDVMPKNRAGGITNNTMRYLVHRHFSQKYGWFIKGLQPAGASWLHVMSVTPDVRQVTKYIAPTYLHEELLTNTGSTDLDLHRLALFISTLEHLIHAEMLDYIYSLHRIMRVKIAGPKDEGDLDTVLSAFMLLYAFGSNLEVSTKRDLDKSIRFLEANHKGWQQLQTHVADLKRNRPNVANDGFDGVLGLAKAIATDYRDWQNPTCKEARERLMAMPSYKDGRVDLADIAPVQVPGFRVLFAEQVNYLQKLGTLDQSNPDQPQLILPNYITSQALCLTTASYYTVCCHNPCEDIMAKLERSAAAPDATPDQIASALGEGSEGRALTEAERTALSALAASGSRVELHGRPLAGWLHGIFPTECPMPSEHATTNPKTPHEWMADPGSNVQDTEELMLEISDNLVRYTTMGLEGVDESVKVEEPAEVIVTSVDHILDSESRQHQEGSSNSSSRRASFASLSQAAWPSVTVVAACSMLAMVGALIQSALSATGIRPEKGKVRRRPGVDIVA